MCSNLKWNPDRKQKIADMATSLLVFCPPNPKKKCKFRRAWGKEIKFGNHIKWSGAFPREMESWKMHSSPCSCPCMRFSETVLWRGVGNSKKDSLRGGQCQRNRCSRSAKQLWVLRRLEFGGGGRPALEIHQFQGPEALSVEFCFFHSISDSRANLPNKNKECLYNPFLCLSFFLWPRNAFLLWGKWQWAETVPEPSDFTCISTSYQFTLPEHLLPLFLPSCPQIQILVWSPKSRKGWNDFGWVCQSQRSRPSGEHTTEGWNYSERVESARIQLT